jgi:hypothetical protein
MKIPPFEIPEELRDRVLKIFRARVQVSITGCWEWTGRTANGYGYMHYPGGKSKWAHRVSYALFNRPIEKDHVVDHRCRNTKCVNPQHLRQNTHTVNCNLIYIRQRRDAIHSLLPYG